MRGHTRPDLHNAFTTFVAVKSLSQLHVVYRPETAPLQIVAVLHGKRNIRRIL